MYGVLKAIGARCRTLFAGLVLQAAMVAADRAVIGPPAGRRPRRVLPPGVLPYRHLGPPAS